MLIRETHRIQTKPGAYGLLAGLLVVLLGLVANASCVHHAQPTMETRIIAHYDAAVVITATCTLPDGAQVGWFGSGVIVNKTRILTAAHVVETDGASCVFVAEDSVGHTYLMYPIAALNSDKIDLASMEIISPVEEFPTNGLVSFGHRPAVGDRVCVATAFPRREYKCGDVMRSKEPPGDIRIYVTVEPGNSGSGVYNMDGDLIGIAVHTYPNRGNGQYVTGGASSLEGHVHELLP